MSVSPAFDRMTARPGVIVIGARLGPVGLVVEVRSGWDERTRRVRPVRLERNRLGAAAGLSPAAGSGDHAVDENVDGESEALVAVAGDHLGGVGGDQREPVGRQAR